MQTAVRHVKHWGNAGTSSCTKPARLYRSKLAWIKSHSREFPTHTSRSPPFTTEQFHVLLNSLFKVLFNFPSRYLFAIGLGVIFSLTRSLPRTLSCTPKQLDSRERPLLQLALSYGSITLYGLKPLSGGLGLTLTVAAAFPNTTFR